MKKKVELLTRIFLIQFLLSPMTINQISAKTWNKNILVFLPSLWCFFIIKMLMFDCKKLYYHQNKFNHFSFNNFCLNFRGRKKTKIQNELLIHKYDQSVQEYYKYSFSVQHIFHVVCNREKQCTSKTVMNNWGLLSAHKASLLPGGIYLNRWAGQGIQRTAVTFFFI